VSPVIGVVLLLAVTVTLGLVVGPAVIGNIGSLASETPNGEFAFFFEEGDEGGTDDFGTSLSAGDGLMIVEMESDRNLDPANVELQSETTGGSLLTDTPDSVYAPGDLMRQGDTLRVAATRGETLRLVWTGTESDQSAVLSELRVPERGSSVPPGVPEPTLGCDWLDSETASGDLFVTQGSEFEAGDVLACDSVSSTADGTVDIEGELTVVADIDADTVNLRDGGFSTGGDVYGSVTSAGDTDLAALSVTGPVTAGGDLTLDGVTAESGLDSANAATVTDSTVSGTVVTGGDLTLDNTTVTGDIEVGGSLTCEGGSTVAGEDCTDYRDAKFDLDITATTWPGVEGDTLRVEAVAENVRIDAGSRDIDLVVDGTTHDTVSVSGLDSDQSERVVLEWTPGSGDAGEVTVNLETSQSSRDSLDSKVVAVAENLDGLPVINEFSSTAGNNEITVDWNVSAGASNLSVVTVEATDAEGDLADEETWFLDSQAATGSVTFDGLDAETHSVTLGISDQQNEFRQALELTTPT